LAVAFEHDTAFCEGAKVEMVCLEGEKRDVSVGVFERGGGERSLRRDWGGRGSFRT
jgi:hypothetical protein